MKKIHGTDVIEAVDENIAETELVDELRAAIDMAVRGIAHDAVIDLLLDEEYPGDDEYEALLARVAKFARPQLMKKLA